MKITAQRPWEALYQQSLNQWSSAFRETIWCKVGLKCRVNLRTRDQLSHWIGNQLRYDVEFGLLDERRKYARY